MANRISAIWDLGLFAVIGLAFLTVTSLTFIPALELMPVGLGLGDRARFRCAVAVPHRLGKRAFVVSAADPVGSAPPGSLRSRATLIRVDSNFVYFKRSSEVRQASR